MFDIYYTKKENAYIVLASEDKFYVKVTPCKGYPKTAKRPYKGQVYLIKNNKFIPLRTSDPKARPLYSAIMDTLNRFIQRQKDIQDSIKEAEQLLED